jgi:cell division protein FtsI (penicillin-binding protein 3)
MQNLFVALTPAEQPRYLLLIATEKDHLLPDPAGQRRRRISLEKLGRGLLADIVQREEAPLVAQAPPLKSPENLRQFFISKRLSLKTTLPKEVTPVGVMPQMHGMSLRKGLQQIDKLKLKVRINGSGRIVAQYPLAGQPLLGIKECVVTLESR